MSKLRRVVPRRVAVPSVAVYEGRGVLRGSISPYMSSILLVTGIVMWVGWFFYSAFLYFDVTDNGLYLLAADTRGVGGFGSGFGQVTGILFGLVTRDIPAFRIAGMLILWGASYWLTRRLARVLWSAVEFKTSRGFLGLVSIFPVVSHYSLFGLQTPSYNWLSQVGILLAGAVALEFASLRTSLALREIFLYLGMFLAAVFLFWSKPSALLMVAAFGIALLGLRSSKWLSLARLVLVSASSLLAIVVVANQFSSFQGQLAANLRTLEMSQLLDPTYELANALTHFLLTAIPFLQWAVLIFAASTAAIFFVSRARGEYRGPADGWNLILSTSLWLFLSIVQFDPEVLSTKASVVAYLIASFWLVARIVEKTHNRTLGYVRLEIYALLVAAGIPIGQAFGSNNGFVQVSLGSGIVISMAAIVLRKEIPERAFSPLALVSQIAIVAWVVASAYTNSITPYRSAPMLLNDTRIDIRGSSLYIDSNLALELESLRKCAALEGWERGTGLLDYTRWSPGIPFMLDARVPATLVPIIGGYEGSRAFAIETVRAELRSGRADAFLENAWILLPRAETSGGAELLGIAEEAIGEFGKTFLDYQSVCVTKDVVLVKPLNATG